MTVSSSKYQLINKSLKDHQVFAQAKADNIFENVLIKSVKFYILSTEKKKLLKKYNIYNNVYNLWILEKKSYSHTITQ